MCTNFGVDGSNSFPFRVQTHKQTHINKVTDTTDRPTYGLVTAGGVVDDVICPDLPLFAEQEVYLVDVHSQSVNQMLLLSTTDAKIRLFPHYFSTST